MTSLYEMPKPKEMLKGTNYEDCTWIFEGKVRGLKIPDDLSKAGCEAVNIIARSFLKCGIKKFGGLYLFDNARLQSDIAYAKDKEGRDQAHHVMHFGVDGYFVDFLSRQPGVVMTEELKAAGFAWGDINSCQHAVWFEG